MARRAADHRSGFDGLNTRDVERAIKMLESKSRGAFATLRIPEDATPDQKDLAILAGTRIVDVLMEKVHHQAAPHVLKAAFRIRDEINGPLAQKVEIEGSFEAVVRSSLPEDSAIDVTPPPSSPRVDVPMLDDRGSPVTDLPQGTSLGELLSDD